MDNDDEMATHAGRLNSVPCSKLSSSKCVIFLGGGHGIYRKNPVKLEFAYGSEYKAKVS